MPDHCSASWVLRWCTEHSDDGDVDDVDVDDDDDGNGDDDDDGGDDDDDELAQVSGPSEFIGFWHSMYCDASGLAMSWLKSRGHMNSYGPET